jgi:hypothetical protein
VIIHKRVRPVQVQAARLKRTRALWPPQVSNILREFFRPYAEGDVEIVHLGGMTFGVSTKRGAERN